MSLSRKLLPLLLLASPMALAEDKTPTQRVEFQTESSREVENDLMSAVLSIEASDESAGDLASSVNRALNTAMTTASKYPVVRVTTGHQRTWPVYDSKNRQTGWRMHAELRLESRDFRQAGELISVLQQTLLLQQLQFSVAPETRKTVENALLDEAIHAFRERADRIRADWGAREYELVSLNLGNSGEMPPLMMMQARVGVTAAQPLDMSAGQSRVTVTANGSIALH